MQQHISALFPLLSALAPDVIISTCSQIFHDVRQKKANPVLIKGTWIPHDTLFPGCAGFRILPPLLDAHWEENEASVTPRGVRRCNLLVPGSAVCAFHSTSLGKEGGVISKLELWLWLSGLLLPVGHAKEKGRGVECKSLGLSRQGHFYLAHTVVACGETGFHLSSFRHCFEEMRRVKPTVITQVTLVQGQT